MFFPRNGVFSKQPDELKVEFVDGPRVEMFFFWGGIAGKFINMGNKKADAWTQRWMAGLFSSGWLFGKELEKPKGDLYVGVWI